MPNIKLFREEVWPVDINKKSVYQIVDGRTDRQTDRRTDRQTDGQTDRKTGRLFRLVIKTKVVHNVNRMSER